jgi:hypothetical protein
MISINAIQSANLSAVAQQNSKRRQPIARLRRTVFSTLLLSIAIPLLSVNSWAFETDKDSTVDGTLTVTGNMGIGQSSAGGANGKLQVTGGIGLTGNSEIRQSTNADGSTLRFLGTQFISAEKNSISYGYSGRGLIASVSPSASALLLDAGSNNSNTGHRLQVINGGDGIQGSLEYKSGNNVLFKVDSSSGNVGIGTTPNPSAKLQVSGGHNDSTFRIYSTGNGTEDSSLDLWASEPGMNFTGAGIGNNIKTHPFNGKRNNALAASFMRFHNGDIHFATTKANSNAIHLNNSYTRMLIDSKGNVGIGTTTPQAKLDVAGKIEAGKGTTQGGIFLQQKYSGGNIINSLSSNYSSGSMILGYGAAGMEGSGSSGQLVSTFDNTSAHRAALRIGAGTLEFLSSQSPLSTKVGDEINLKSRFKIDTNGNVGIGTTSPDKKLSVVGTSTSPIIEVTGGKGAGFEIGMGTDTSGGFIQQNGSTNLRFYINGSERMKIKSSGNMDLTGSLTQGTSDRRLKDNLTVISDAIKKVNTLSGYEYDWKAPAPLTGHDVGLIAQEVQAVYPEAVKPAPFDRKVNADGEEVSKSGKNYLTVQYEKLVPLLVQAIKEQQQQIDAQKAEIKSLTARLEALEAYLNIP